MDSEFFEDLKDPAFLKEFIQDWNDSRLDMFALSTPNENLQYSGVMRFYFQDRGQKAVTKCIRVNNMQAVADIMPTLIEKFCPDMKMLSTPNYELYEIHGTGDVRKLSPYEKPLIVQLLWHNDDREGRFVLKSADLKIQPIKFFDLNPDEGQLKRRLSRREKKDLKKKRKAEIAKRNKNADKLLADHVYRELPESSLTRTISNPEAVMRRRRQQKLEKRMKEFQSKEGPQTGGILKIFAESLKPEIPYKTILASVKDTADVVTKAALDKFLLPKEDPGYFCIVMAIIPPGGPTTPGNVTKERIIRSSDCPLAIQNSWPRSKGVITFHLRRREPGTEQPTKTNDRTKSNASNIPNRNSRAEMVKLNSSSSIPLERNNIDIDNLPYFIELTPEGKEINYKPKIYHIGPRETVIGSSRNPSPGVQYLQLFSPKILASHCSIVNDDSVVSIVPHGPEADVRISGKRIYDSTLLHTGKIVQFGGLHTFRFQNPLEAPKDRNSMISTISDTNSQGSASFDYPPYRPPKEQSADGMSSPPISPELKELILSEAGTNVDGDEIVETTFGVDGEVATNLKTKAQITAAISAENLLDFDAHQLRNSFRKKHNHSLPDLLNSDNYEENLLPASLTFMEQGKDAFFASIINGVNGAAVNFKLAPTYTLYLAARHILSPNYRMGLNKSDRSRMLSSATKRIASSIQQTIQENDSLAGGLAFWMANASELLHFYRQDSDIGPLTMNAQAILAQSIQESFALLVNAMEEELSLALPAFLEPSDSVDIHPSDLDDILNDDVLERAESMELLNWQSDSDDRAIRVDANGRPLSGEQWVTPAARIRHNGTPVMADILYILSSAMSLLRRCRVNAALTIQLFSQLFHFINMWTFNQIVLEPNMRLCTRLWGHRLRMRLSFIEAWAERQGLELAADCHLARVVQTAHLLEAPKDSADDIADIASACFKLNSLQLRFLLENYIPDRDEPLIPHELIDSIVAVAESTSDELTLLDGRDVKLEEDFQLQLPFLLPEEGYSSDIIRGVPPGLQEFLEPICETGLCELNLNPHSLGLWTVYQEPIQDEVDANRDNMVDDVPPIQRVTIDKGKKGLGLSICSAKGTQSDFSGIYIKAVIPDGLADQDGRLEAGDQILSVNESSLIDVTQTQAAKIMGKSGPVITLELMKHAAYHHGLSKLVQEDDLPKDGHKKQRSTDSGRQSTNSKEHEPVRNGDTHYNVGDAEMPIRPDHEENSYRQRPDDRYDGHMVTNYEQTPIEDQARDLVDGYGDPIEPDHHQQSQYNESDYDSDGNLIDDEEKARRLRQRQREIEYEERLAKWEEERKKQEELVLQQQKEEDRKKQETEDWAREEERRLEEEAELRYEEEVREEANRRQKEKEARQEAERIRMETERRRQEYEQKRREDEKRWQERERSKLEEQERKAEEERRLIEEQRLAEEKRKEENIRRKKEMKIAEEKRQEEKQRRIAEEKRHEEERIKAEEKRREEERRFAEERKLEQERYEAEERRRQDEERIHQEQEELERNRLEEERRKRREDERRRIADEERIKAEMEERKRMEEERIRSEQYMQMQKRRREDEAKEKEEQRRKEKQRLIDERRKKDNENRHEEERRRKEAEEKRQRDREAEIERKREKDRRDETERQRRLADEKKRDELVKPLSTIDNSTFQLDEEMASIDDALREAERIAAEMDLFMLEEEQKIEDSVKEKHKREQREWESEADSFVKKDWNHNVTNLDEVDLLPAPPENLLSDEDDSNIRNKERYETNIDSSDGSLSPRSSGLRSMNNDHRDPMKEQQRWIQEQKEKREKRKQEQERIKQNRLKKREDEEREMRMLEIERKKEQDNKQMNDYRRMREEQEQRDRQETERQRNQPHAPAVKPKNFKYKPGVAPSGIVESVRGEYKAKAAIDYDRRRSEIDRIPQIRDSLSSQSHLSSDDEDAPPRPPPPKHIPVSPRSPLTNKGSNFNYRSSNGYQPRSPSTSARNASINSDTGLSHHDNIPFVKRTPPPAVVNQGVGEPEVLDFRAKMKLFGK